MTVKKEVRDRQKIMDGTDDSDDIKQWTFDAWRLTLEQVQQLEALNEAYQSSMIVEQIVDQFRD